jgi:arylsulfatase A-like enzyme
MSRRPNIILISADSLRADFLGCYQFPNPISPNIDAMAGDGVLFENMFCPVIPTQPSHTTIFTGQHALTHGVVAHGGKAKLPRSAPFLPELLLQAGYSTCAVDTLFRERMWFGRGYEYIIDPSLHHVFYASVTQEELNRAAIQWIRSTAGRPFYVFIHYWDPHYPYTPPERYRGLYYNGGKPVDPDNHTLDEWWGHPIGAMARDTWLRTPKGLVTDPDYVTSLYYGEVKYLDDGIADLNSALDELGILEDTMIVLLADHGESMTEHRVFYDHYGLYDCTLRVPLIVRWPNGNLRTGARLAPMRQLSDVAPTILEAAGVSIPEEMDGKSLLGQMTGAEEPSGFDRIISLESTWQAKYCLRTERHKFILAREQDLLGNPPRELYDLSADPLEVNNLAEQEKELASDFEQELEGWIAGRLRALGKDADPVRVEGASMVATWKGHRT